MAHSTDMVRQLNAAMKPYLNNINTFANSLMAATKEFPEILEKNVTMLFRQDSDWATQVQNVSGLNINTADDILPDFVVEEEEEEQIECVTAPSHMNDLTAPSGSRHVSPIINVTNNTFEVNNFNKIVNPLMEFTNLLDPGDSNAVDCVKSSDHFGHTASQAVQTQDSTETDILEKRIAFLNSVLNIASQTFLEIVNSRGEPPLPPLLEVVEQTAVSYFEGDRAREWCSRRVALEERADALTRVELELHRKNKAVAESGEAMIREIDAYLDWLDQSEVETDRLHERAVRYPDAHTLIRKRRAYELSLRAQRTAIQQAAKHATDLASRVMF